jgi:hypothetical protein
MRAISSGFFRFWSLKKMREKISLPKQQERKTVQQTIPSKHSLIPGDTLHYQYVRSLQTKLKIYLHDINHCAAQLCGNIIAVKMQGIKQVKVDVLTPHEESNLLVYIRELRQKIARTQQELSHQISVSS